MSRCLCCGFDPDVPTPTLDRHAERIRDYLAATGVSVTVAELAEQLGIPEGTIRGRYMQVPLRRVGVRRQGGRRIRYYLPEMLGAATGAG